VELEEDSNKLKIDQIRDIQKEITYKPYETDRKIYIIDEAEKMTPQAANSLLKTLEEPPSYAVIILLVEEINRLLPTVISRCQHIRLSNISREKIEKELVLMGKDKERSQLLARIARGSLGRAISLDESDEFLGFRSELYGLLKDLVKADTIKLFQQAKKMKNLIENDFPLFDLLSDRYRDIIIYKRGNRQEIINSDYREGIKEQSEIYTINELIKIIDLIRSYHEYIGKNVRKDLTLQVLLLKIRAKRF
jgi:DNA polymerase-3 subunit delta'